MEFFCIDLSLLHSYLCIYLFIQSFISISMAPWIFILLIVHISVLLYCIAQIVPALIIGCSFSWLLHPSDKPQLMWVFVCFLSTSMLLDTIVCSWPISCFPCHIPRTDISLKDLGFLLLENSSRNQELSDSFLAPSIIASRPSQLTE